MYFKIFQIQCSNQIKAMIFVSILIIVSFFLTFTWFDFGNWNSDNDALYQRPYAMASYLSLTGFEGVAYSHLFTLSAQRLALSWIRNVPKKSRMQYDMVLLVSDPYGLLTSTAASLLRDSGWILVKVDPLYGKPSSSMYLAQNRYTHTAQFTKLQLWKFDGYMHIIYLDADMLVVKDLIRAISGYNMTSDTLGVALGSEPMINAGMLLITPSKIVFDSMVDKVMTTEYSVFYQEQAFLDVYWHGNKTVYLPSEINEIVNNLTASCVVMHFIGNLKPWNICQDLVLYSWPCAEWHSYKSKF